MPLGAKLVVFDGPSAYIGGDVGDGIDGRSTEYGTTPLARTPVLAVINESAAYAPPLLSSGKSLLVSLVLPTNTASKDIAFTADYRSRTCSGEVVLPEGTGTVTDGSDAGQKTTGQGTCSWRIKPNANRGRTTVDKIVLIIDRLQVNSQTTFSVANVAPGGSVTTLWSGLGTVPPFIVGQTKCCMLAGRGGKWGVGSGLLRHAT